MADHLPLPEHVPANGQRRFGGSSDREIDRRVHGGQVRAALDTIIEPEPGDDEDPDEPVNVLALKISTQGQAKTGPFRGMDMELLGEDEDWNYYVISDTASRNALRDLITEYSALPSGEVEWEHPKTWADLLDSITGVEIYGAEDRADPSLNLLTFEPADQVECFLWPAITKRVANQRIASVEATLTQADSAQSGVAVLSSDPRPDRLVVRAQVTRPALEALLNNPTVQRVVAPPRGTVTEETLLTDELDPAEADPLDTTIGVVDGIVSLANPYVAPFVQGSKDFPAGHAYPTPDPHGTKVAGIAIWGGLDNHARHGEPLDRPAPIASARVLALNGPDSTVVVGPPDQTIEDAIRWLVEEHEVRVITISINYPTAAELSAKRTVLTYVVDQLARELEIVIVVSAGNLSDQAHAKHVFNDYPDYLSDPEAGIAAPGDAALAVTVGSLAHSGTIAQPQAHLYAISQPDEPSHFTRTGKPGRGSVARQKPEFVHFGGNGVWNVHADQLLINEPGTSVVVPLHTRTGQPLGYDNGTSFTAPAVAHEIALIADRYPDAGPNLLRALTALSGDAEPEHVGTRTVAAYGIPSAANVLESGPERVILTYEGTIETATSVVHAIPIPREFAEQLGTQHFAVALAFDPPVRRNRREYIAGRMDFELVRDLPESDVVEIYGLQPNRAERIADPSLQRRELPQGTLRPRLDPPVGAFKQNTLIKRAYLNDVEWDTAHDDYFLVVTHRHNPGTASQHKSYTEQNYSVAVELALQDRADVDLYALINARLRGRARGRR